MPTAKPRNGRPYRRRRAQVLRERGGTCWICGHPIDPDLPARHPLSASIDHVQPVARGGTDHPSNLRAAHLDCNRRRGTGRTPKTDHDRSARW